MKEQSEEEREQSTSPLRERTPTIGGNQKKQDSTPGCRTGQQIAIRVKAWDSLRNRAQGEKKPKRPHVKKMRVAVRADF